MPLLRSRCETYSNQRGSPDQNGVKDFIKVELEFIFLLKIEPCGLGSRVRDMEAESYN